MNPAQELEQIGVLDALQRVYRFAELNMQLKLRDDGRLALAPAEVRAILSEMNQITGGEHLRERTAH